MPFIDQFLPKGLTSEDALLINTLTVPAVPEELATLHSALDSFWLAIENVVPHPPDQDWRLQFVTAVAEIAANIVRHAYPNGTARGSICLHLRLYIDHVEACFIDEGITCAFPPELTSLGTQTGESTAPSLYEVTESGYGLAIARAVLDWLDYQRTGDGLNCWWLGKRFSC